jgi:hypothetical protein
LVLQGGERRRCVAITNSFLLGSPGLGSQPKRPIVNIAAATKDPGEFFGLGIGWIESESESVSYFHSNNIYCVSGVRQELF